tara:strand:+ start:264 stop:1061 length:798 start_codon:yes stop_codon:yes gene_type:complete
MLVDVHTHLTHEKFTEDLPIVLQNAEKAGLGAIVVNGLNPDSNKRILDLAEEYEIVKPALGIYPIDALNSLDLKLPFPVKKFDVFQEIELIGKWASQKKIIAIGECGLDGYWVDKETFPLQEQVFESLIEIGKNHDLPLIIHTRKMEKRSIEILKHNQARKVNFHCFCGKVKHAVSEAENEGWYFSIPANARRSESFTKMLQKLPMDKILTETDAPYLAPEKGQRNEPQFVKDTVRFLAELRNIKYDEARQIVWENFIQLFKNPL